MTWNIRQGDVLDRLREMPDESVQCCVTSPPYWGLRDYGVDGQTVGWAPTCSCRTPAGDGWERIDAPRPCVVLDPFAGSGTTLLVAERLGRDSLGIELNPEYVAIAERRIRTRDPMAPVEVAPGMTQPSLFGDAAP